MFESIVGKYRNIVVSVALFLILDASVLILNFYISFEISEDALGVNLAGRQRMLSQRMVKSLFDVEYSSGDVRQQRVALAELKNTVHVFNRTLNAFDVGGSTISADGIETSLAAVSSNKSRTAVENTKLLWDDYKQILDRLDTVLEGESLSVALTEAIDYGRSHNLQILKEMNNLTVELEAIAASKARRLRLIQTVGISLAVINFFIILFHFIRQMKDGDKQIELARGETLEILETVDEGLFLIDKDYLIGSQYSRSLERLFARNDLAGLSLEALLNGIVSKKDLTIAKRFIALLYREEIKQNLIGDLNPLRQIEVQIPESSGGFVTKYFSFQFERAYRDEKIKDILVTVVDVSEKVVLERELKLTREQNEQQIEVLTSILHANPEYLQSFVENVFHCVRSINAILKDPAKTEFSFRKKLDLMFVEIHRVKGEAASLSLDSFEETAHDFETQISQLKALASLSGDDFIPLVVRLEKLTKLAETVKQLAQKMSSFSLLASSEGGNAQLDDSISTTNWDHLFELTESVAKRSEKVVELVASGLNEVTLSPNLRQLVNDIAIQGLRNAIVHGIELPKDRLELNKPEIGRIDIRLVRTGRGDLELSIKDDGYGISFDAIRANAVARGRLTEQQAEAWDGKRLVSLIFEPGFSTAQEHSNDAGAGVGMDLIKTRINEFRGKIRISTREGLGTKFVISFPNIFEKRVAA